jgi:cytochrome c oxidase subunit III
MTQTVNVPLDPRSEPAPLATGRLGMRLLLLALGVLFAATLSGYLAIRGRAETWPPPGVPELPASLWISTVLIVASSFSVQWAVRGIRRGLQGPLRLGLALTAVLGVAFLVSQTVNWFSLVAINFTAKTNLYGFLFYLLTALHAVHVLGGLVPLGGVTACAHNGRYTAERHNPVEYIAMYWHFLAAVWLVLFAVLLITS